MCDENISLKPSTGEVMSVVRARLRPLDQTERYKSHVVLRASFVLRGARFNLYFFEESSTLLCCPQSTIHSVTFPHSPQTHLLSLVFLAGLLPHCQA